MATESQTCLAHESIPRGISGLVSETAFLFQRWMLKLLRRPIALYFSLIQPVVWLLLFGQIFNRIATFPGAAQAFGGKSYFQFFMPAVILQTLLFGSAQSGIGIINDMDSGFLDKLLTTPVNRMAILLGKVLADLTRMLVQSVMIVLLAWIVGQFQNQKVTYSYGIPGLIAALAIALLFGLGLAGLNVFIAVKTRNTESTFLVANFLTLPLLFTSSAQLPIQLLPNWLQQVAQFNPVTYTIDTMRFLINGEQSAAIGAPATLILKTLLILGAITALTLTLAVRGFRKSVR
jgi:ABC-2 type transport system permease protein